jgi:hypothetical protein
MLPQAEKQNKQTPYELLCTEFVEEVRSQLSTLSGEIAQRNKTILQNDSYVYGDLLQRSLHVVAGHDFTPVNWLRRVAEIHRTQTLGDGFTVTSSYHGVDVDSASDPNAKSQLNLVNNKKKSYAELRNKLFEAIIRDNGGEALFARMVENASVIGDTVLKAWYDEDKGKYRLDMVEAVEHFYAMWNADNFRDYDFTGYVYQVSKQEAADRYQVPETVATSPLGMPLAVLSSANTVQYISTQPMVTIMEVNGKIQGWKSNNGIVSRCKVGDETLLNAVIVGNHVYSLIDDVKYLPHYYIFPNKITRRRPWGLPDITDSAININQTYIETLSDWRTVASKVNFPKYKAFGFGIDTPLPAPKARTVEMIGLGEGQDIVPMQQAANQSSAELDFARQLQELKEAFVRETGISAQLFDMPDQNVNSRQTGLVAMHSISDQVEARRQLWEPIIVQVMNDALDTLSHWDSSIKEIISDDDWYTRVTWPPALRKDDPTYVTMVLNQTMMGYQSVQTTLERLGINAKEELDRINDEMDNPITAAIHGRMLGMLAQLKISGPPTSAPPKINVNLRGDLTPPQEGNLAEQHGFNSGPMYGPSMGPQGELGIRATDNAVNGIGGPGAMVTGQGYSTGQPNIQGGQTLQGQQGSAPQPMTPPTGNAPGQQVASVPGSGQATPNSPQGNINQHAQRHGKK